MCGGRTKTMNKQYWFIICLVAVLTFNTSVYLQGAFQTFIARADGQDPRSKAYKSCIRKVVTHLRASDLRFTYNLVSYV